MNAPVNHVLEGRALVRLDGEANHLGKLLEVAVAQPPVAERRHQLHVRLEVAHLTQGTMSAMTIFGRTKRYNPYCNALVQNISTYILTELYCCSRDLTPAARAA